MTALHASLGDRVAPRRVAEATGRIQLDRLGVDVNAAKAAVFTALAGLPLTTPAASSANPHPCLPTRGAAADVQPDNACTQCTNSTPASSSLTGRGSGRQQVHRRISGGDSEHGLPSANDFNAAAQPRPRRRYSHTGSDNTTAAAAATINTSVTSSGGGSSSSLAVRLRQLLQGSRPSPPPPRPSPPSSSGGAVPQLAFAPYPMAQPLPPKELSPRQREAQAVLYSMPASGLSMVLPPPPPPVPLPGSPRSRNELPNLASSATPASLHTVDDVQSIASCDSIEQLPITSSPVPASRSNSSRDASAELLLSRSCSAKHDASLACSNSRDASRDGVLLHSSCSFHSHRSCGAVENKPTSPPPLPQRGGLQSSSSLNSRVVPALDMDLAANGATIRHHAHGALLPPPLPPSLPTNTRRASFAATSFERLPAGPGVRGGSSWFSPDLHAVVPGGCSPRCPLVLSEGGVAPHAPSPLFDHCSHTSMLLQRSSTRVIPSAQGHCFDPVQPVTFANSHCYGFNSGLVPDSTEEGGATSVAAGAAAALELSWGNHGAGCAAPASMSGSSHVQQQQQLQMTLRLLSSGAGCTSQQAPALPSQAASPPSDVAGLLSLYESVAMAGVLQAVQGDQEMAHLLKAETSVVQMLLDVLLTLASGGAASAAIADMRLVADAIHQRLFDQPLHTRAQRIALQAILYAVYLLCSITEWPELHSTAFRLLTSLAAGEPQLHSLVLVLQKQPPVAAGANSQAGQLSSSSSLQLARSTIEALLAAGGRTLTLLDVAATAAAANAMLPGIPLRAAKPTTASPPLQPLPHPFAAAAAADATNRLLNRSNSAPMSAAQLQGPLTPPWRGCISSLSSNWSSFPEDEQLSMSMPLDRLCSFSSQSATSACSAPFGPFSSSPLSTNCFSSFSSTSTAPPPTPPLKPPQQQQLSPSLHDALRGLFDLQRPAPVLSLGPLFDFSRP